MIELTQKQAQIEKIVRNAVNEIFSKKIKKAEKVNSIKVYIEHSGNQIWNYHIKKPENVIKNLKDNLKKDIERIDEVNIMPNIDKKNKLLTYQLEVYGNFYVIDLKYSLSSNGFYINKIAQELK